MKSIISVAILTLFVVTAAFAELPSASDIVISQALASGQPTILDLGARTCIPCKKMAPILEALATEYQGKANVLFVDVWEDKATAKKFRVQMIPTQIFFDAKGKEVKRHVGGMEKTDILKELKAAGLK
jgi:thioredoxin 1